MYNNYIIMIINIEIPMIMKMMSYRSVDYCQDSLWVSKMLFVNLLLIYVWLWCYRNDSNVVGCDNDYDFICHNYNNVHNIFHYLDFLFNYKDNSLIMSLFTYYDDYSPQMNILWLSS